MTTPLGNEQLRLTNPAFAVRLPTAQLEVGKGLGVIVRPEHGRWAGNLELSTRRPGDALYLLKLLLRELAERGDCWQ